MHTAARLVALGAALAMSVVAAGVLRAQSHRSFDHSALARSALEGHIKPGYHRLEEAGVAFEKAVGAYCAKPDAAGAKAAHAAFDGVVTAWGRIEHITFGPIAAGNRIERILFFPDRRGLGARQIAAALRSHDASVTNVDALSRRSVALQGLGAFEVVLLADVDRSQGRADLDHRCRFGLAIAGNIAAIAKSVSSEWRRADGFAKHWLEPGAGNPAFLKNTETTLALAKALSRGIEQVRDERIVGPLGFGPQRRRLPAVLGSSARTMRLVQANIDGLHDLWTAGGMQAAIIATRAPEATGTIPELAALVGLELGTASKLAGALLIHRKPFDGGTATRSIISMGFPLKNARHRANLLLGEVAGVTLGFNSSDGD